MNNAFTHLKYPFILALVFLFTLIASANVNIKEDLAFIEMEIDNKIVKIQRIQDTKHKLSNNYTKTSRLAPPFTIQPFEPVKGVKTISELDVLDFMVNELKENSGLLIDARLENWYEQGSILGSMNIPFSMLSPEKDNSFAAQVFELFGATKKGDLWDFSEAQTLVIFDNGPWCQQGVQAIRNIVQQGYPKSKIKYYRGGMQYWHILGLTTTKIN